MSHSPQAPLRSLHRSAGLDADGAKALQAVRGLVAALSRAARLVEQRTGMSNAQLFLLQQIAAESDLSVNELAARAMTHQSTASVVLSRLERRGLVKRVRSPMDARSVVLRLTPAGRRLLQRAPAPATSAIVSAIARLSRTEVRMLRAGLTALGREAGFTIDDSPMLFQDEHVEPSLERRESSRARTRRSTSVPRSRLAGKHR